MKSKDDLGDANKEKHKDVFFPPSPKIVRGSSTPRVKCWANLRTPEEAKKGLCINAVDMEEPDCNCVADRCVAYWRWEVFDSNGKAISKRRPTHGFCSQGGQP